MKLESPNTPASEVSASIIPTDLVNADEAAKMLHISKGTIYHWVRAGFIPSYRAGRLLRIREADLAAWLKHENLRQPANNQSNS